MNAAENAVVGDCERYREACHGRQCCRKCGGRRLRTISRSVSRSRMLPKMRWSAIANDIAKRVMVANAPENAVVSDCERYRDACHGRECCRKCCRHLTDVPTPTSA